MTGTHPGLIASPEGNWVYRRAIPKRLQHIFDRKNYVIGLRTSDEVEAKRRWITVNRKYEREIRKAELKLELSGPNEKIVRRKFIWSAIARWLGEYIAQHGGRLPLPRNVEIPDRSGRTLHPFQFVRAVFEQWAEENEPDAILLLDTADSTQGDRFFSHALVGAYFIIREMLESGPMPEGKNVAPPPLPGRWRKSDLR